MKKNILIFCTVLTSFSLIAFGFLNWSNTETYQAEFDLFYNVDSRFINTITKENLHNAKSVFDILPEKETEEIVSFQSVQVNVIDIASESGEGDLNTAQLKLLQSTDYSSNIFIKANYKIKNTYSGKLQDSYLTYYMSITPEKEAEFKGGYDALIEYLRENSKEKTAIIKQDKLKSLNVNFTVTKEGTITNVNLNSTSGYSSVDEAFVELIKNMSEKWNPATNSKGEKVDQELIFSFGLPGSGC